MKFKPFTEREISDQRLWAKGDYAFEIIDGKEQVSQAGNPMFRLKLRVSRPDGTALTITDFVLPILAAKFRACCCACGLLDQYSTGTLCADAFLGRRGRLRLGVEKGENGYADRNIVLYYLVTTTATAV
jgi:hypothetical protein